MQLDVQMFATWYIDVELVMFACSFDVLGQ